MVVIWSAGGGDWITCGKSAAHGLLAAGRAFVQNWYGACVRGAMILARWQAPGAGLPDGPALALARPA